MGRHIKKGLKKRLVPAFDDDDFLLKKDDVEEDHSEETNESSLPPKKQPQGKKSKMQLFEPEEEEKEEAQDLEEEEDDEDDDDEEDDGAGETDEFETEIERQAKKLDAKKKKIESASAAELTETLGESFVLPTGQQIRKESLQVPDLVAVKQRIQDVLGVLNNFSERREKDRSRQEYMKNFIYDLGVYYNYSPYLIELFTRLFTPDEVLEFLEANEVQRPLTIRTNSLKTRRRDLAQALINRGVNLDTLPWSKVGLVIYESSVPIGATPEYLAGHYLLQGAASFIPVMALDPKQNEKVLDMCAAPGGKSSYLAALMKNTGKLFCNDAKLERTKALIANLHRLGVRNSVVLSEDGRTLPKMLTGLDRVLLDAPCTGLGVISRDPTIKLQKTEEDVERCSHLQKELLLSAIDCVDARSPTGGYIVYCTCSITIEENEAVVDYALKHRRVKIVELGLPPEFGRPGLTKYREKRFHQSLSLSRHYYPHTHNLDGFYVCKLKKCSNEKLGGFNDNDPKPVEKIEPFVPINFFDEPAAEETSATEESNTTGTEETTETKKKPLEKGKRKKFQKELPKAVILKKREVRPIPKKPEPKKRKDTDSTKPSKRAAKRKRKAAPLVTV